MKRHKRRDPRQTRLIIFLSVLIAIPFATFFVIQLAKGYRPDLTTKTLKPTGLLVARSKPDGAQVSTGNQVLGITNTTSNLEPGSYSLEIKAPGFHPWAKQIIIEKELVTTADALLFPTQPLLTDLTQTDVTNFLPSPDRNRLTFLVPLNTSSPTLTPGIYIMEISDSPLNLNRNPKLILGHTPVDLSFAQLMWSPDSKVLLARIPRDKKCTQFDDPKNPCSLTAAYTIDTQKVNSISANILSTYKLLLSDWESQNDLLGEDKLKSLTPNLQETLATIASNIQFSPDQTKILYTATASATLLNQIVPPVPGANTQPQSRLLVPNATYVYDTIEDKNFLITLHPLSSPTVTKNKPISDKSSFENISWFASSRHLIKSSAHQVTILEYDNTNSIPIYTGNLSSNAFPSTAGNRLFLLINFPQNNSATSHLYSITLSP